MNKSIIVSNFNERLKELMFDKGMSAEQLAHAVGVSRTTAYRWTSELSQIRYSNLIKVADYFECLIEYLIGRSEDDTKIIPKPYPDFVEQVRKIMREQNISTYKFEKISKFKYSYLVAWKQHEPTLQTLIDLADILGCSIDYLIGRD